MLPAQTPMPILGPGEIPPILSVPAACIAGFPIPIDPATNDAPLEFNTIRSQPPIVIELDNEDSIACLEQSSKQEDRCTRDWSPERERGYRDREKRDRDRFRERIDRSDKALSDRSDSPIPVFLENGGRPPTTTVGSLPIDSLQQQWGMMYPVMAVNADPSMMGMVPMNFNQFSYLGPTEPSLAPIAPMVPLISGPAKEIIHCKSCTLFPPNPNGPPPTTRERPPGCRTIFVGGLPENITEEIIREVFQRCGQIVTVRMSKKNFCHIRFDGEAYVDNAIFLSGYRIRIGSNTDPPNTGRLHVDYAQARDDLYEWECHLRQIQREQRHRERIEQELQRPPSPPPVVHYSDHEASLLTERLKSAVNHTGGVNEDTTTPNGGVADNFSKAIQTLITWLERGDCTKKNSGQFYSMIQSSNSHVRRLMNEKAQHEQELQKAKEHLKQQMRGTVLQFNQIEKVFLAANHQKVWDHFTKAQRKNIDMWKKQAQEIKKSQFEDALNERVEDEMDFSDDDGDNNCKKIKLDGESAVEQVSALTSQVNNLQEENDNLRCQVEAYKNEVDLIKTDNHQELEERNKQIRSLQQALQGMQQQLIQANQQRLKDDEASQNSVVTDKDIGESQVEENRNDQGGFASIKITEKEAKLIGLLSTFLHVHPFGASVDYIWSYLQRLDSTLRPSDVEALLLKFPSVFKQEFTGVGASLERKWQFTGFQHVS